MSLPNGRTPHTLDDIVERCIDDLAAGRATVDECLARWPEQRDELEPLLRAASAFAGVAVEEPRPDPARRAAFMAELRRTPQQSPRRRLPSMGSLWPAGWGGAMPLLMRGAVVGVPAAAIAVLAILFAVATTPTMASAATLTVFAGQVEQRVDGAWVPLTDGASLTEGVTIRTDGASRALVTFPDGSTAAVDHSTEVTFLRIAMNGQRHVEIAQATGRIWNDVVTVTGSDSYVVRTPHAVVSAHGTVFETLVDGTTDVHTVEGFVRIVTAEQAVELQRGQASTVAEGRVQEPREVAAIGAIVVRGAVAAYLVAPDGSASGILPNGVLFRQVPGVFATGMDTAGGVQQLVLGDVGAGQYSLIVRRVGEGEATVEFATGDRRTTIPVPADLESAWLDVTVDRENGIGNVRTLDRQMRTTSVAEVPAVRVVETARSRAAVDLGTLLGRPAAEATATAEATAQVGRPATPRPSDVRPGPQRPGATPEATRTPAARPSPTPTVDATVEAARSTTDAWAARLREALRTGDDTAVAALIREALAAGAGEQDARMEALIEVLGDEAAAARLATLLSAERLAPLADSLADALERINPGVGELLREQLLEPPPLLPFSPSGSGSRTGAAGNGGPDRERGPVVIPGRGNIVPDDRGPVRVLPWLLERDRGRADIERVDAEEDERPRRRPLPPGRGR